MKNHSFCRNMWSNYIENVWFVYYHYRYKIILNSMDHSPRPSMLGVRTTSTDNSLYGHPIQFIYVYIYIWENRSVVSTGKHFYPHASDLHPFPRSTWSWGVKDEFHSLESVWPYIKWLQDDYSHLHIKSLLLVQWANRLEL